MKTYSFSDILKVFPTYEEALKHTRHGYLNFNDRMIGCPSQIDYVKQIKKERGITHLCEYFHSPCQICWAKSLAMCYNHIGQEQQKLE